jgi:hypothetical protein
VMCKEEEEAARIARTDGFYSRSAAEIIES